jgi:hypothetical protein
MRVLQNLIDRSGPLALGACVGFAILQYELRPLTERLVATIIRYQHCPGHCYHRALSQVAASSY